MRSEDSSGNRHGQGPAPPARSIPHRTILLIQSTSLTRRYRCSRECSSTSRSRFAPSGTHWRCPRFTAVHPSTPAWHAGGRDVGQRTRLRFPGGVLFRSATIRDLDRLCRLDCRASETICDSSRRADFALHGGPASVTPVGIQELVRVSNPRFAIPPVASDQVRGVSCRAVGGLWYHDRRR